MKRMHVDELDIDIALVRRLVAAQFPEWAALPLEPVPFFGTDNAIYRLGSDMSVRLPRREQNVAPLRSELRWLPKLAPLVPLAVPVPVAVGEPADGYPFDWAIYQWVEGEPATIEPLADLAQAASDLAELVTVLQRIDSDDGPPPRKSNFGRGAPLSRRDEQTRVAIAALRNEIDADAVTAEWEAALATPEWNRPPVWLHGDLDGRNMLVKDGRLFGVIDWGSVAVGDPACDVMVVWKMLPPETRHTFREALSIDDATWARSRGWAVSQAVIALAYYTLETNAVIVHEARHWIAEVLADHA